MRKALARSLFVTSLALAGAGILPSVADAAEGFLQVKGKSGNKIKGGVTQKGHEGDIQIIAVSHEIISPRDSASGLPTGKRQHKPITVTIPVDKATPLLFQALVTNEALQSITMPIALGQDAKGKQVFFEIKLENVFVSSIKLVSADNRDTLEISFVYQKIVWSMDGVTTDDDWSAGKN